jgi:hypothetical protein
VVISAIRRRALAIVVTSMLLLYPECPTSESISIRTGLLP